jgi:tRNA (mo5U34)-methyltransferase
MIDARIQFYMKVPLGDGTFTNGRIDYNHHPAVLGIDAIDLTGMRVLDVAANDGFWTFWSEGRGADVVAIDVDGFDGYDWGHDGPPASIRERLAGNPFSQWNEAGAGFRALHEHFDSRAERLRLSAYDLRPEVHGVFDVVFNYGLLYHLRHPLLALDIARRVCRGALVLETHIVNGMSTVPLSVFYHDDVFRGWTNWTGPTEAVVAAWLRSAGFPVIKTWRQNPSRPNGRQVFVACTNATWAERFGGPTLVALDDAYFAEVAAATRRFVEAEDGPET